MSGTDDPDIDGGNSTDPLTFGLSWWWLQRLPQLAAPVTEMLTNASAVNCSSDVLPSSLFEGLSEPSWTEWSSALQLGAPEPGSGEIGSGEIVTSAASSNMTAGSWFFDERPYILRDVQPAGIGCGVIGLGALLIALGANLMRLSARKQRSKPAQKQRCYPLQPIWCIGLLLLAGGHALSFVAALFAPLWIATLCGLSVLLWNALLAKCLNREPLTILGLLSLLAMLGGLATFVVFGSPAPTRDLSPAALDARWRAHFLFWSADEPQFFFFVHACTTLVVLALTLLCDLRLCLCSSAWKQAKAQAKAEAMGARPAGEPYDTTGAPVSVRALGGAQAKLLRMLYPLAFGLLAGWTALLSGCLRDLLASHLRYPHEAAYSALLRAPHLAQYLLIGALAPLPLQIHCLARALALFEAQAVLPLGHVPFVLTAVGGGSLFAGTWSDAPLSCLLQLRLPLVLGGLGLAVLAFLLLGLTRRALPPASSVAPAPQADPYASDEPGYPDQGEPALFPTDEELMARHMAEQQERAAFEAAFAAADTNGDGKLDRAEFERFMEVAPKGVGIDLPQTPVKQPPSHYQQQQQQAAYPPEPLPQPPPMWEPAAGAAAQLPMTMTDDEARADLMAELDAQRQQIAQLQQAMADLMQRDAAPPPPLPPMYGADAPAYGYDHAAGAMLPPQPPPPGAYAPPMQAGPQSDPGTWPVPEGTQAGQVFLVNGEYYVAIPKPQSQPLPPIAR